MTRVGIDVVDVDRIEALYRRFGERFLERLYTPTEVAYAEAACGSRRFERLAARFAAKEALIKASGRPLPYRAIEVTSAPGGRPLVRCALVDGQIQASLSHTERLAVACVILEETTSSPRPSAWT